MTDITTLSPRELLEAAAKFCGKKVIGIGDYGLTIDLPKGRAEIFNPLTDAGDRARMCDENQISIRYWKTEVDCEHSWPGAVHTERYADHTNNRTLAANYAATRLAARLWIEQQGDAK